ncbi:MAG: TMEM175 family protein [Massilia sp.]
MGKTRLEAFSDGVIAIIITIMVLELKVPHGATFDALLPLLPVAGSYVLSFVYVGIYWNNHHHMLQLVQKISGGTLWANLHLLFWLSLTPFTTAWMGENHFEAAPVALYGFVLLMCSLAYSVLARVLTRNHPENRALAEAIGIDRKGWISVCLYVAGMALSLPFPLLGFATYVLVAIVWLVPDPRIEKRMKQ